MLRKRMVPFSLVSILIAVILDLAFLTTSARSANNGFFNTYNSEVERGEVELMLMNDLTQPSSFRREDEKFGTYFSHMLELEYGVTDQYASEFMVEWFEDMDSGKRAFSGFRWENRFRLFKDPVPLNPMVYAEYEDLDPRTRYKMEVSGWVRPPYTESGKEPDRERIFESRLVLSDKFGAVDWAFNWINETDMGNGTTAFGYSFGTMWKIHSVHHGMGDENSSVTGESSAYHCPMHKDVHQQEPGICPRCGMVLEKDRDEGEEADESSGHAGMVGVGMELFGALGDTRSFRLDPKHQEHYLGPIFMYHPSARWMVHTQLGIGLSKASDNLVRLNLGYEF